MKQSELVEKFIYIQKRAEAVGLTLKADLDKFSITDAPKANGVIVFNTIDKAETFIYGYELGYKSGLK